MKVSEIEEVMKLMIKHKCTALRSGDLELAIPAQYEEQVAQPDDEMSEDELLFFSAEESTKDHPDGEPV